MLLDAVKQQRLALACAITAGFLLIVVFHAPIGPVLAGCCLALGFFILRAASKSASKKYR
jgi:MFS superfamily sulfate permease-like transporter